MSAAMDNSRRGAAITPDDRSLSARLDAARGVSAIVVLLDHSNAVFIGRLYGSKSAIYTAAATLGEHAVLVFFLLSGHLITRSILQNVRRNSKFSAKEYVASRLARIYPPLVGSILVCVLIAVIIYGFNLPGGNYDFGLNEDLYRIRDRYTLSVRDVLMAITMQGGLLQANGPLWTLNVEFQIYIAALSVAVWWQSSYFCKAWAALLGLLALSYLSYQLFMVSVWLIGAATALFPKRYFWRAAGIVAVTVVLILELRHTHLNDFIEEAGRPSTRIAFCLIYTFVLFYSVFPGRPPELIVRTGDFSYSLYIVHFPILLLILACTQSWIGHSLPRTLGITVLSICAILTFATLFASITEKQTVFKDWMLRKDRNERLDEPA